MRVLLTILAAIITAPMLGCAPSISLTTLDKTATQIFDGKIAIDDSGKCTIESKNKVVDNIAYVTPQLDGSKLILFRTWQGKGANLRGILFTNGPALTVGSEIELVTFQPTGPGGGLPIGRVDVSIDSEIKKRCYRVSFSLD